jgi:lipopolysaccharide/colanic/teichoic acid biosynthesis glycosyltransferase
LNFKGELATVATRQDRNEEIDHSMLSDSAEELSVPCGGFRASLERALAAAALVVAGIPLLIVTLLTWANLGRPLLYYQGRAGLHGVPFKIVKFRTMVDTRDTSGALLPDAQRTTPVTRFLRRIRLDELPQLFSIVRGQMVFVGPRPLWPETIREMGKWGAWRCKVRPGLTGWSQVNGGPLLSNAEKLACDIWYVDHQSLWLDLSIVLRTALILVMGDRINRRNLSVAQRYFANADGSGRKGAA